MVARSLAERLNSVHEGIGRACDDASRSVDEITLIVVTKFHPVSLISELLDLGVRHIGENRHQEALEKFRTVSETDPRASELTWHFVGQLQSKKARAAIEYASVIHSLDRESLRESLERAWLDRRDTTGNERLIDCFMQVNLTDDPHRGGVAESGIGSFAESLAHSQGLNLCGVMAVAPLDEDPDRAFERVAGISERLQTVVPTATSISAGMSEDYASAIAWGATHLRIGSAITGNRPNAG